MRAGARDAGPRSGGGKRLPAPGLRELTREG
jgi:hypothetical protein